MTVRGEPPEKFCGEAKDMTAACMIQTLCENKIFKVSKYCRENGDPDKVLYSGLYTQISNHIPFIHIH